MKAFIGSAKRLFRAAVATGLPLALQWLLNSQDPTIMALTPALMAVGKFLRDRFGWKWIPI